MFMWSDYRSNNASYIVATIHHRPVLRVLACAPLSSSRLQLLTYGIGLLDKSGRCNYWLWSHLDGSNAIDSSVLSESMHAMPIYRVHMLACLTCFYLYISLCMWSGTIVDAHYVSQFLMITYCLCLGVMCLFCYLTCMWMIFMPMFYL